MVTRKPGFDLAAELAKPSFTPGARDAPALAELVARDDVRAPAALASLGDVGRRAVVDALGKHDEAGKARLVGVLGLLARAGDGEARALLIEHVRDPGVRVRRAAESALGKLGSKASDVIDARAALLARWEASDVTPDERRVLVEALGKIGGDDVLARLRVLDPGADAELARRRDRALLMADRSAKRDVASAIVVDVAPPRPVTVVLGCKPGLAGLLVDELASVGVSAIANVDRAAEVELAAPLQTLFASHLWQSFAVRVALPAGDLAEVVVQAMTSPALRALLAAWTRGPIRWRLGFASGHKRAVVWRVARDVTAAAPELVNDPTQTTWDVLVDDAARVLELVPKKLDDPRFAWRVAEVPAASQPSVAAALVWVAGMHDTDRVWDPFCGSGVELVERARCGKVQRLVGTDVDDDALRAAAANAQAAGVIVELAHGDARTYAVGEVDAIITNPPLGSRVHVDAAALLVGALPNLVRQLAPGGRLVWITPALQRTTTACEKLGLARTRMVPVDLGGVRGHLERWEKPR